LLGARNTCARELVSIEIRFEGSVRVDRSQMRERIPTRRASMPKTTIGKSKGHTRLGEEI